MASSCSMASVRRSRISGTRDLGDDLAEEAAHHQAAGLLLGDSAGLQVEQLLVVETAGGAGMSGADDLAGLDLQVGHRVGAGAVGEHQIAVHLEGVGAGGLGADQHVAHPDGVRVGLAGVRIALQRTLVEHVGPAVGLGVVDQQPRFQVLAVVGEVQAEQFGVAAGRVVADGGRHPHHLAAEGHRHVAQHRVLAQPGVLGADVHHVVGPVGDPHHRQAGGVGDDELDVVGVGSAAAQVDDDDGFGEFLGADLQVAVGGLADTRAGDGDLDRASGVRAAGNRDHRRVVERRERLGGNAIGGHPALAESVVAAPRRSRPSHRPARRR